MYVSKEEVKKKTKGLKMDPNYNFIKPKSES